MAERKSCVLFYIAAKAFDLLYSTSDRPQRSPLERVDWVVVCMYIKVPVTKAF